MLGQPSRMAPWHPLYHRCHSGHRMVEVFPTTFQFGTSDVWLRTELPEEAHPCQRLKAPPKITVCTLPQCYDNFSICTKQSNDDFYIYTKMKQKKFNEISTVLSLDDHILSLW